MDTTPLLLTPLALRGLVLSDRLVLAPLAGYSDLSFRLMAWRHGRPAFAATEMISARSLLVPGRGPADPYLARSDAEGPVQYQLWGKDPAVLAEAARICEGAGADLVDLNCGCPVRKVISSGCGAALLRDPALVGRCLDAMRRATALPLSAKIRLGPHPQRPNAPELLRIAESAGADFATVHARFANESYNMPARLELLAEAISAVQIPVFGNGDARDGSSAAALHTRGGAAGVMVGRAGMGFPWVFERIRTELAGGSWRPPSPAERGTAMLEHFRLLVDAIGPRRATRHIRKLACFYSRGLSGAREFRVGVNHCANPDHFAALCAHHFGATAPEEATP